VPERLSARRGKGKRPLPAYAQACVRLVDRKGFLFIGESDTWLAKAAEISWPEGCCFQKAGKTFVRAEGAFEAAKDGGYSSLAAAIVKGMEREFNARELVAEALDGFKLELHSRGTDLNQRWGLQLKDIQDRTIFLRAFQERSSGAWVSERLIFIPFIYP